MSDAVIDHALRLIVEAADHDAAEVEVDLEATASGVAGRIRAARVRVRWHRDDGDPTEAATIAAQTRERLPWDHYAPDIREALKDLAARFPAESITDAAHRLEELLAEHGPAALAARRARQQQVAT